MTGPAFAMSTSDAARYLGVSLGTVRRWADSGGLEHSLTPGGQRRFSVEQLQRFVDGAEFRRSEVPAPGSLPVLPQDAFNLEREGK